MAVFTALATVAAAVAIGSGITALATGGFGAKQGKSESSGGGSAQADLAAAEKASAERAALANDKRRAALSRSRTIYTSPLGLSEQANAAKKTLTGT